MNLLTNDEDVERRSRCEYLFEFYPSDSEKNSRHLDFVYCLKWRRKRVRGLFTVMMLSGPTPEG